MGAIKDIVDLVTQLENRVKDRRDIELLRQMRSLASSVQMEHAEVVERDIRVMQENAQLVAKNAELARQLAEAQAEDVLIHKGVEFRRGKRTSGNWQPFCPECHMPGQIVFERGDAKRRAMACTTACGWRAFTSAGLDTLIKELEV